MASAAATVPSLSHAASDLRESLLPASSPSTHQHQQPLYEDGFVRLTPRELVVKCYYFPLCTPKHVPLAGIKEASLLPMPSLLKGGYKHWGMALDMQRWWPSDIMRHRRTQFIEVDTGAYPKIAFTTAGDVAALHAVLLQAIAAAKREDGGGA